MEHLSRIQSEDVVLFFDGFCNLCSDTVTFILRHERDHAIRFSTLQSDLGKRLQKEAAEKYGEIDSFLFVIDGKLFIKSTAVLLVADHMLFPFRLARHFMVIPASIRDKVYDIVARHRYKFFGKKTSCMVPTRELDDRFIK